MYNAFIACSFTMFIAGSLTGNPVFSLIALLLAAGATGIALYEPKRS